MVAVDIDAEFLIDLTQRVLTRVISSHIRIGRCRFYFIPGALCCQRTACRAVIYLSDDIHHVIQIQRSDIELCTGLLRHDIRCFSAVSDHAVDADIRGHMLPQAIRSMEHELCRIQCIDTLPRCRGSMGCLAMESIQIGSKSIECAVDQILVVQMDHHRHIVMVKHALLDQRAFRTIGLFDWCADYVDICVQLILQLRCRNPGKHADGSADTVAAGMPDARQRIVLRHDRHLIFMVVSAVSRLKGCW